MRPIAVISCGEGQSLNGAKKLHPRYFLGFTQALAFPKAYIRDCI